MGSPFHQLVRLFLGVVYLLLKNTRSRDADKKTKIDKPSERQSAPKPRADWSNAWEDWDNEEKTIRKLLPQNVVKRPLRSPTHRIAPTPITQLPPVKRIDRILSRYSSWKKAIIISELIQPRT